MRTCVILGDARKFDGRQKGQLEHRLLCRIARAQSQGFDRPCNQEAEARCAARNTRADPKRELAGLERLRSGVKLPIKLRQNLAH